MSDNVVTLNNITSLDLPVDRVLDEAKGDIPRHVMVIGWDNDGEMYFASSVADGPESLWLLETAKAALMGIGNGDA
jgi:hypothetical protein